MFKNITKKIMLLSACIIMTLGLSGCGSGLQGFAETTLPEAIRERGEANKNMATKYMEIGALSKSQYEKICANIDKQVESYAPESDGAEMNETVAQKTLNTVSGAVSHLTLTSPNNKYPTYVTLIDGDGTPRNLYIKHLDKWYKNYYEKFTDDGYGDGIQVNMETNDAWCNKAPSSGAKEDTLAVPNFVMSNYIEFNKFGGKHYKEQGSDVITIPDNEIKSIELLSDDVAESLNSLVKAELYVLRPDQLNTSDVNAIDGLIAKIQAAVNSDDSSVDKAGELNNYFNKAVDFDGNPICIINKDDHKYDMVQQSKANDGSHNEPGYDLIIGQYDLDDCIHVRFTEFNQEAYDELNAYLGQDFGRMYLLPDPNGTWKAYLMVYPIDVIDSMKLCTRLDDWATGDGGYQNIEVTTKKSGLGINLMYGQFVKFEYDESTKTFDESKGQLIDLTTDQLYLTLSPAQNNDAKAECSLIINGISRTTIKDSLDEKHDFYCGRIILRDYLEATYAPNYNSEGNLVVFGRKIRLNMSNENFHEDKSKKYKTSGGTRYQTVLVYERGTTVATFVDVNGQEIPGSPTLEITDFCDAGELNKKDPKNCWVRRLPYKNEEPNSYKKDVESDTPDISELSLDTSYNTIRPVTWFPSKDIGKADYRADTKQKQRFYCIATTKGMFGSALYSSWVESTVPDANLDWWNEYLATNGFSYKVEHQDVAKYLTDNYKYQLSQSGVIILDLETIEKIQDMYDEEADQKRVGTIRTAFVIIGWLMIFGSFLLMLLWVVDTNTDLGFGLLEKATFGHWVAVKYESDIPAHNVNDQKYVTFKIIVIKTMIVIAMGIILLRVDIFWILTLLVDLFGEIASQIEKLIKGRI